MQNIGAVDSLEFVGPVTHIDLSNNLLESLEDIESVSELKVMNASYNMIRRVADLHFLDQLMYLDLSNNCLEELDPEVLPSQLSFLKLQGNPICKQEGYRPRFVRELANLKKIDDTFVTKQERRDCGCDLSSSGTEEEEEEEEATSPGSEGEDPETPGAERAVSGRKPKMTGEPNAQQQCLCGLTTSVDPRHRLVSQWTG